MPIQMTDSLKELLLYSKLAPARILFICAIGLIAYLALLHNITLVVVMTFYFGLIITLIFLIVKDDPSK